MIDWAVETTPGEVKKVVQAADKSTAFGSTVYVEGNIDEESIRNEDALR
jgi:hypothetical protein